MMGKALDHIHLTGKALNAEIVTVNPDSNHPNNAIVTVKFNMGGSYTLPQITVPVFGAEWHRHPFKKGDKGLVVPADVDIGNTSGLGPQTPPGYARPANLGPLFFQPIGNLNWTKTEDVTANVNYGDTGTVNRDTNKKSKHVVHPTNGVTQSTGAQGQTGPESSPTYNMTHALHPMNGWLASILDSTNGTHMASLVPQGGSGVLGWLASVFGGKHKHQIDNSGHTLTTTQTIQQTATNGINLNGGTPGVNIQSALNALSGISFGSGGAGGGATAGGAISVPGPITTAPVIVSALPVSPGDGARAFVTDATATTFASIVAGLGGNHVPVYYDGGTSHWRIG